MYSLEARSGVRLTAVLLALLIPLTAFAACGSGGGGSDVTTDATSTPEETEAAETELKPDLPDKDFGGKTFNIFGWTAAGAEFCIEEESGDVIEDAIFHRESSVEELFNVNITCEVREGHGGSWGNWIGTIENSILAGDDAYQLVAGYGYRLAAATINGNYRDLANTNYLDISMPWWSGDLVETSSIGGALYLVFGYLGLSYLKNAYAIYYNKTIAEDLGHTDLYETVDSGDWTFDELKARSKGVALDLNGDGVFDSNDRYGYLTAPYMDVDAYLNAFDVPCTEYDGDGMPVILPLSEKMQNTVNMLYDFFFVTGDAFYTEKDPNKEMFRAEKALFAPMPVGTSGSLRDMESDFGFLPYPKYDDKQDEYRSFIACHNVTGFCIPITADEELSNIVTEYLAYESYKSVRPAYYDVALKSKYTRDPDSERMLDLIYSTVVYDFTLVYSFAFGDQEAPSMMLRMTLHKKSSDIASMYAARTEKWAGTLETLISGLA